MLREHRSAKMILQGLLSLLVSAMFVSAAWAQQGLELLPNLAAQPAGDISVVTTRTGELELRLSATTFNRGDGALELFAGETGQGRQNIYQRVYLDDGSSYARLAGTFVWHEAHAHFHFEDYALYTLQQVQGKGKSRRTSAKTTFCVMDTDLVDGSLPGAPAGAVYDGCGETIQGMSVGWADTYRSHLAGQEISLSKLKDGDYRLIIEADPQDRILETDETDNTSCMLLRLNISAASFEILDANGCGDGGSEPPPPPSDVGVDSIDPAFASVGSFVAVEILGSGFTDGLNVIFENGEGYRPTASEIVVQSDTRITATVTVRKRGGNKPDHVWDLRVGDAILPDAFTVDP
jgi:hypothetical protein